MKPTRHDGQAALGLSGVVGQLRDGRFLAFRIIRSRAAPR